MTIEVLCIGHAAFDLSLFVNEYPTENTKIETGEWLESGGGPAANAAYLLSHWGTRCAFAGLVGEDYYGRCVRDELAAVGVDVSRLQSRPNHATPLSVILVNRQSGSRTIINRKVQNRGLELNATALPNPAPKVLMFDGHEPDASLVALQAFPEATSILDAGSWRAGTATLARKVDYLLASERFARQATNHVDLHEESTRRACLAQLRERYRTTVVVTLGERGLIMDDGEGFRHMPAFPASVVDTTGAGDIFHGAFAFALSQETPLTEGLRFAAMAASLSVRVPGGRTSIPTLAQVKEALSHVG